MRMKERRTPTTREIRAYLRAHGQTLGDLRGKRGWAERVLTWVREEQAH